MQELIHALRITSGCGLIDCRLALVKYNGDYQRALTYLRYYNCAVVFKCDKINPQTGKVYTFGEWKVAEAFGEVK